MAGLGPRRERYALTVAAPGAATLIADFFGFARGRSTAALILIVAGALLEGAGIVMLVPIISLILGTREAEPGRVQAVFAWLGLEERGPQLAFVLSVFAAVLVLRFVVILLRTDLLTRLRAEFVADLRARAFRHLAVAPWGEVAGLRQAPIGHALTRDVDRAANGIGAALEGGVAAVMLVVQFALALVLAPVVTLCAGALALGLFRALRWLRLRAELRGKAMTSSDLALFDSTGSFLRGLKPAKAHGLEGQYVAAFEDAARRVANETRAFALEVALGRLILQTASGGIGILVILLGLFVLETPPENLIVALVILARLYTPLQMIQNTTQIVRHSTEGYRTARLIAGPKGRAIGWTGGVPADPLPAAPEVSLDDVTVLGGAGAAPILGGVSARLPAGRVTALIGESGAGKSTLCDLAVGLIAPDSGTVRIDGAPLDDALTRRLRASIAYVGQEPFLFEDSLRNNLCWGCGPVDEAEIWRALRTVGAEDLVRALEGDLDGSIRTEGTRFSGGERQRLRLARALLRRPRLLVLDEATGALDLDAESAVLESVLAARGGATVLMVSHRPSTLHLADHAIVLERGRLREAGPVAELAQRREGRLAAALALAGGAAAGSAIEK